MKRKSVCLIAQGMAKINLPLQPWCYLYEVARGLAGLDHPVTIFTDINDEAQIADNLNHVSIECLSSVRNPIWMRNTSLQEALADLKPDVVLWNVGMFSFLYQRFEGPQNSRILGIFTSPIYQPEYFFKLGFNKLLLNFRNIYFHLLGSLIPRWLLRYRMEESGLTSLIVQTKTTYRQLIEMNLWQRDIQIISPGVDSGWFNSTLQTNGNLRRTLGYSPQDILIVFYGSPATLRGLPTLVKAFNIARNHETSLRLLILSRRRPNELVKENSVLEQLVCSSQYHKDIQIIDGYLDRESLIEYVMLADIISLPFELIPSDAPLAPLEAVAIGRPVVATRVGCLPELVSKVENYLAEPGDPVSLSQALLQVIQDNHLKGINSRQISMRNWKKTAVEWSQLIQSL